MSAENHELYLLTRRWQEHCWEGCVPELVGVSSDVTQPLAWTIARFVRKEIAKVLRERQTTADREVSE